MLTSIYPAPDLNLLNNTNVCHYFAKEWVKMGYNVIVVFNYPIYLRVFHVVARYFEKLAASKFSTYIPTNYLKEDFEYEIDGVRVIRMPLFKPMPYKKVPRHVLLKQVDKIISNNLDKKFIPDVIVAHNYYPFIDILFNLKKTYKDANTCIVVHKQALKLKEYLGNTYQDYIDKIDTWGFRSLPLKREFENKYGTLRKTFICYSGVPSFYFKDVSKIKKLPLKLKRFVYVGSFIKRKYPDCLLDALHSVYPQNDFNLDYVGQGNLANKLRRKVDQYKMQNQVLFHGHLPRLKVLDILLNAECFIMISKDETFGLVYLEAMSQGCITIASKNEGMEGIIVDGENGFLCEAGNYLELSLVVRKINSLSIEDKCAISRKAKETAFNLSDSKVAQMYIDNVII